MYGPAIHINIFGVGLPFLAAAFHLRAKFYLVLSRAGGVVGHVARKTAEVGGCGCGGKHQGRRRWRIGGGKGER